MSIDTYGRIKGYVSHEQIFKFICKNYDPKAVDSVSCHAEGLISEITWPYQMNEHSQDNENKYSYYGYIHFNCKDEQRSLFYSYSNVNSLENLNYYSQCGLEDMVRAETTFVKLGRWGRSVEIVKEIITHFGGGWIDENDCDSEEYYPI